MNTIICGTGARNVGALRQRKISRRLLQDLVGNTKLSVLALKLFDPLALWQAQCTGTVSGQAMLAGHFIPEELPEATAAALLGFMTTTD